MDVCSAQRENNNRTTGIKEGFLFSIQSRRRALSLLVALRFLGVAESDHFHLENEGTIGRNVRRSACFVSFVVEKSKKEKKTSRNNTFGSITVHKEERKEMSLKEKTIKKK